MKKRQITIIVITLSIIMMGYLTMLFLVSQKELPERKSPIVVDKYVKAERVNYSVILSPVKARGRMRATHVVDIVSEASGKIERGCVSFKKGQSFKKGDVLARIYMDEAILDLKAKKSKFMNSIALILADLKVDYPNSYSQYLLFFNNINLDKNLPNLPDVKNNKLKLYLSARNVLSDYYIIKRDEAKLRRNIIIAPFDGSFLSVNQEVGSYTNTGGRLAQIICTDNNEIEVSVSDAKSKWISEGDGVNIFSDKGKFVFKGKVVRKSAFLDINTQSRVIFVGLVSDSNSFVPGQYINVEFEGKKIKNCMEIPRSAVFNSNQVFVVDKGKLQKREIDIIKRNEESVIFNGLEISVSVVIEPLIDVRENSDVKIL